MANLKDSVTKTAKRAVMGKVYLVLFILIVIAALGAFLWINPLKWDFKFGGYAKIAKTENVVEEVKKISEFTTACFYQEMVVQKDKNVAKKINIGIGKDSVRNEIVLIVKGKVRAGFDLQKVSEENLKINSDSLSITVPKAEIFDVIINPSDYEVYIEDGKWSHEEISKIQIETESLLKQRAIDEGILEKANTFGIEKLKTFFKSFGFAYVDVKLEEN